MLAHLRGLTKDGLPSRSSIGRYAKQLEAISKRVRGAKEIADRLVAECGPQVADGKGFQVLVQAFQSLAFDFVAAVPEGETLDPENLSFLARAIGEVARAQKTDTDRTFKIQQETAKSAASRAEEVAKARGISADTVDAIRRAVLGVTT